MSVFLLVIFHFRTTSIWSAKKAGFVFQTENIKQVLQRLLVYALFGILIALLWERFKNCGHYLQLCWVNIIQKYKDGTSPLWSLRVNVFYIYEPLFCPALTIGMNSLHGNLLTEKRTDSLQCLEILLCFLNSEINWIQERNAI